MRIYSRRLFPLIVGAAALISAGAVIKVWYWVGSSRESTPSADLMRLPSEAEAPSNLQVPKEAEPVEVQFVAPADLFKPNGDDIPIGDGSGWVVPGDPKSIALLICYLRDEDEVCQSVALMSLGGMGTKAMSAVPAIVETLNDPKISIRIEAATTLIEMNMQLKTAIMALMKELKAEAASSRAIAARAIERLVDPPVYHASCWGPDPPPRIARPWVGDQLSHALLVALHDPISEVRAAAEKAISKLDRYTRLKQPSQ